MSLINQKTGRIKTGLLRPGAVESHNKGAAAMAVTLGRPANLITGHGERRRVPWFKVVEQAADAGIYQ